MKQPTPKQIAAELAALETCKSYIPARTMFGDDNIEKVNLQIAYLRGEIDTTADEWNDYTDDEQSVILEAENWKTGDSHESPSSGWDTFKPKVAKAKTKTQRKSLW